ncbi:MAG: 2-dehydropantoate 2-reductase [Brevibacillus sp.]|nr:2-dehydropantoate 2-reductase [Brevibacillus sp.]
MRVVVVGGGAVGLLMAGRLARAGLPLTLVTREPAQADALRADGLKLQTLDGHTELIRIEAVPFSSRFPEADVYMLAVKQPALPQLLPALSSISSSSRVIAMQNGMGHEELLSSALETDQLYFAVSTEGACRHNPLHVEHTGKGQMRLGPLDRQGEPDPLLRRLIHSAGAAGIRICYEQCMRPVMWRKLVANALINPLTALHEIPNGALVEQPYLLEMMRQLFDEAVRVARAEGVKIGPVDWEDILTICRNTSRNHSSMLQDLRNGRQTEIEAITGFLIKTGQQYRIAMPAHETLYRSVLLKTNLRQARRGAFHDHSG